MTKPQNNIADVVVVGGGGSGLAAASAAARLGRSVILLEKAERLGGGTAWSVGSSRRQGRHTSAGPASKTAPMRFRGSCARRQPRHS
jgi:succinate dehydrogenase/fumarate reductase flavoprotein subunit